MRIETLLPGTEPNVSMGSPLGETVTIRLFAEAARRIEGWGFDGLTTPETGHDPFLPLVTAAQHTRRISLGTNVAIAFPRSPMVVAQTAWDLQGWSGGRFKLGLGSQVKGHNERRYSAPWPAPAGPRMREYVMCLRSIFKTFAGDGAPTYFQGQHYQFTLISPFFKPAPITTPHVPIYVSALNPYMARLAGELCDGLRLHPLTTVGYAREVLLPAVEAGAETAGRSKSDLEIVVMPFVITGANQAELEAAKAAVRLHIAFYASTRTYHAVMQHHGWGDAGLQLHGLSVEGKWQQMGALISDEMLDVFAVVGTYDEVIPMLRERWREHATTLFIPLPAVAWADSPAAAQTVRALLGAA